MAHSPKIGGNGSWSTNTRVCHTMVHMMDPPHLHMECGWILVSLAKMRHPLHILKAPCILPSIAHAAHRTPNVVIF